ncbi:ABC transporter permease [Pseudosulfitobacter koreensis]|uniref:FtsX-like permease family protein n=1 Tax=Pseudosulfitobacter koreensis TaxID=2968472 RepID=A0ABT1Z3I2_9RHOB|nr:FtsX-like permease family protein [Pseudosulfitobacter koreense]MCR8827690.1 FtsX-like permease family protein [Pseudosulfitobacter koreense]
MSLRIAARLARRELRGGLHGFRIFLACLALGVAAIAAVGSVRSAIDAGLTREGAALLGGQAELDFTYRFATDEERAWMDEIALDVSRVVDFRSMAVVDRDGTTERGLTQVKGVDDAYPLIGSVGLDPEIPLDQALGDQDGLPGAIMQQVLADRLGLRPGDTLRLGTRDFRLSALLTREPDSAGAGFGLGPRTIVRTEALQGSGLLETGTLFNTKYRLMLPPDADLDTLEDAAEARFGDAGMRWRDSRNGAPGVARFVERLGAFLVLVGLSGLAVGGVGVSAAVRAYLAEKTSVIATLRTLGAERATIFQTYFIQIGALSLLGIAIGLTLGAVTPVLLAPLIEARLPIPANIAIYPRPLIEAGIYGLLTAFIFTLWPLARAEDVRAATLFRDALGGSNMLPKTRYVIAVATGLVLLIGLAGLFSGTWRLTLWMAGGIAGALVMLVLAAWVIRWTSRRGARMAQGHPALRWALAAISGPREGATSTVLSLGLGLSVLASIGQIDGNLRNAIAGNLPEVAPSYFFVDIQKDQMEGFTERLVNDPAVSRIDSAPMLRGVITRINDRPAREVAGDHWVTRGDRGVTYATELPDRTQITAGEWWAPDYAGPPLISFATEEAEEMGLSLGDTMTINVLGREITGTIASFREVDFSTAGIGFVMTMNPAALSGAPHSFISTVYATPEAEAAILRDLGSAYPNITAIRVRDAIDRVAEVLAGIAAASSYGAAATLLTGFLVLIGAASAGTQSRTYEAAVLKTLGASRRRILISFALRAALLGLAAGLVALGAGIAGGWAVSRFVMETGYQVIWPSALAIIAGGILATLVAGLAFAWGPLSARPAHVLRARE